MLKMNITEKVRYHIHNSESLMSFRVTHVKLSTVGMLWCGAIMCQPPQKIKIHILIPSLKNKKEVSGITPAVGIQENTAVSICIHITDRY